eukprot:4814874-Pyramimonas_sp.AAC.1
MGAFAAAKRKARVRVARASLRSTAARAADAAVQQAQGALLLPWAASRNFSGDGTDCGRPARRAGRLSSALWLLRHPLRRPSDVGLDSSSSLWLRGIASGS